MSRLESDAHGITTTTLKRIANADDIALYVRFLALNEFADEVFAGKIDREIPNFDQGHMPTALEILATVTSARETTSVTEKVSIASLGVSSRVLVFKGLMAKTLH